MRILQIAPPWFTVPPAGYGGIEWVVAELTDGLVDAGHDVTLLASGGSQTKAALWSVFDTPPSRLLGSPYHDVMHCLPGYERRHDFDLIHDHSGILGPAFGSLLDGPPVVHTLHGPWRPEVADYYEALPQRVHLVAISHDQAAHAPAGVRLAGVVHNGVPLEPYTARDARDDGYLIFLGRANYEKGPEVALEVARRLGRHVKMVVKVNEPAEEAYWRERCAPLAVGADVEIHRNVTNEQKAQLLAGAQAVLVPLQWDEPFGLVMAEAMACGTPVIAYARGAANEIVVDGKTGLLVEPDDVAGLCEAVGRVGEIDPAACREHVATYFTSDAMVAGYLEVYERVLAGG